MSEKSQNQSNQPEAEDQQQSGVTFEQPKLSDAEKEALQKAIEDAIRTGNLI